MAGEYTGGVVRDGVRKFVAQRTAAMLLPATRRRRSRAAKQRELAAAAKRSTADVHGRAAVVLHRLPGAADLHRDEAGRARARRRIT